MLATVGFIIVWLLKRKDIDNAYVGYRQNLGRVILLGLEFLVAGDIIRSVAVAPSFNTIGVLGLIVLVRSFLSIELEMEIEGKWPWQRGARRTNQKQKI